MLQAETEYKNGILALNEGNRQLFLAHIMSATATIDRAFELQTSHELAER
jgi:hypothetical protein